MSGFDFDAIRRDHPLDKIIGQTVKLRRSGGNKVGCCPFHHDKSPSFVVYNDGRYHCFGCGAHGDVIDFVASVGRMTMADAIASLTGGEAPRLTQQDRAKRESEIARQEEEEAKRQAKASKAAQDRWDAALPMESADNAYLARKNIGVYNARREGDNLLLPMYASDHTIQSVQMIQPDGTKLFHAGAPVAGAYTYLSESEGPIVIAEGWATGATIEAATGFSVAVAFSKSNLKATALAIRGSRPSSPIIIAGDIGGEREAQAAADACGGRLIVPDMQGAEGSDFNDQAAHYGLDDVSATFAVAQAPTLPGAADPAEWDGKRAPHRQFIIPGWIVRGSAGLLSGQEGVGKSLIAQQMATCAALGRKFVGLDIARVKAMYVTCEDPLDELWRRQESINAALGCTMADLQGRLRLHSLVGEIGNELGTFDSEGRISPSPRYQQLLESSLAFGAQLTILDNAAHMFAGNENARHDVASFLGLIERYAIAINGAAILLAHPNKAHSQGNKQGNEYSGSTGWSAHVRNRLFIDYAPAPETGEPADPDERVLRKSKANYGKKGEEVAFRWHEWAFVVPDDLPPNKARELADVARTGIENERFLTCLDKATDERRTVSVKTAASNYAPRVFAKMTVAKGLPAVSFELAMERLLHLGSIVAEDQIYRRDNRTWALGIKRAGCTNPRTNHAQTDARSMPKAARDVRHSGALHCTPSSIEEGGGLDAPPPFYDEEGFFVAPDFDPADEWRASDDWERDG